MVNETILGCVFAGLQGSEQSLLCSEDLHSGGWMLCQIQKGALKSKIEKINMMVSSAPPKHFVKNTSSDEVVT